MIHNTYFEIINEFVREYTKDIHGRALIGKVSLSQKGIALALDGLEKEGILTSKKSGNMKFFRLNTKYEQIKDVILITEIDKKMRFMKRQQVIANVFKNDDRIIGIFGSYAKNTQKKDSDIDIFIIGEKNIKDYNTLGKTYDLDISIKYFSKKEFTDLLKNKNPLIKEIVENHITFFNTEQFISLLWRNYYGFD